MPPKQFLREHKILNLDASGQNYSIIITLYTNRHFSDVYDPTLEESYRRQFTIDDQAVLVDMLGLNIWLPNGPLDIYSAMEAQYMKSSEGFVFLYDVTSTTALDAVRKRYPRLSKVEGALFPPGADNCFIVAVRNKGSDAEPVAREGGKELARELGLRFFEIELPSVEELDRVYDELMRLLIKQKKAAEERAERKAEQEREEAAGIEQKRFEHRKRWSLKELFCFGRN